MDNPELDYEENQALAPLDPSDEDLNSCQEAVLFLDRGRLAATGPYDLHRDGSIAERIAKNRHGGRVVQRTVTTTYGPWRLKNDE